MALAAYDDEGSRSCKIVSGIRSILLRQDAYFQDKMHTLSGTSWINSLLTLVFTVQHQRDAFLCMFADNATAYGIFVSSLSV